MKNQTFMPAAIFLATLLTTNLFAQSTATAKLSPEAELLFKDTQTTLTVAEKNAAYKAFGAALSTDRTAFAVDKDLPDDLLNVSVSTEDLNKDGTQEIFIVYGNPMFNGNAGDNWLLLIKNKTGGYDRNLDVQAASVDRMTTSNLGFPDLEIGVPGMKIPVWRWNGKKYEFYKSK